MSKRRHEISSIELPGGRALGVDHFPGGGTPLVCLHGLLDSSATWHSLLEHPLHRQREAFAFDLPGFGNSDCPEHATVEEMALVVSSALAGLGVKRFDLIGHSLGGAVAVALAAHTPRRVSSLFLIAPAGFGAIPLARLADGPLSALLAAAPLVLRSRFLVDTGYRAIVGNGCGIDTALAASLSSGASSRKDFTHGLRMGLRALARVSADGGAYAREPHIYGGPVSALWGEVDQLVPAGHGAGVLRAFPAADLIRMPDVGHDPQRECPSEVALAVAGAASERRTAIVRKRSGVTQTPASSRSSRARSVSA